MIVEAFEPKGTDGVKLEKFIYDIGQEWAEKGHKKHFEDKKLKDTWPGLDSEDELKENLSTLKFISELNHAEAGFAVGSFMGNFSNPNRQGY